MKSIEIFRKMEKIETPLQQLSLFSDDSERAEKIATHRVWLQNIRRERPDTSKCYKIGVYIRYFNQTKHDNYLSYHKKQFEDTLALCPHWELVGFYVDEGASTPNMESAPEWCRLLEDCFSHKVDLIITQKISNVSKKSYEISLCARLLAQQTPPVGIYFISEDLFTLGSYYLEDMRDLCFLPYSDWKILPNDNVPKEMLHD